MREVKPAFPREPLGRSLGWRALVALVLTTCAPSTIVRPHPRTALSAPVARAAHPDFAAASARLRATFGSHDKAVPPGLCSELIAAAEAHLAEGGTESQSWGPCGLAIAPGVHSHLGLLARSVAQDIGATLVFDVPYLVEHDGKTEELDRRGGIVRLPLEAIATGGVVIELTRQLAYVDLAAAFTRKDIRLLVYEARFAGSCCGNDGYPMAVVYADLVEAIALADNFEALLRTSPRPSSAAFRSAVQTAIYRPDPLPSAITDNPVLSAYFALLCSLRTTLDDVELPNKVMENASQPMTEVVVRDDTEWLAFDSSLPGASGPTTVSVLLPAWVDEATLTPSDADNPNEPESPAALEAARQARQAMNVAALRELASTVAATVSSAVSTADDLGSTPGDTMKISDALRGLLVPGISPPRPIER